MSCTVCIDKSIDTNDIFSLPTRQYPRFLGSLSGLAPWFAAWLRKLRNLGFHVGGADVLAQHMGRSLWHGRLVAWLGSYWGLVHSFSPGNACRIPRAVDCREDTGDYGDYGSCATGLP